MKKVYFPTYNSHFNLFKVLILDIGAPPTSSLPAGNELPATDKSDDQLDASECSSQKAQSPAPKHESRPHKEEEQKVWSSLLLVCLHYLLVVCLPEVAFFSIYHLLVLLSVNFGFHLFCQIIFIAFYFYFSIYICLLSVVKFFACNRMLFVAVFFITDFFVYFNALAWILSRALQTHPCMTTHTSWTVLWW